jgi:hypothetical protein
VWVSVRFQLGVIITLAVVNRHIVKVIGNLFLFGPSIELLRT